MTAFTVGALRYGALPMGDVAPTAYRVWPQLCYNLRRCGVEVSGDVLDATFRPVPGVSVTADLSEPGALHVLLHCIEVWHGAVVDEYGEVQ